MKRLGALQASQKGGGSLKAIRLASHLALGIFLTTTLAAAVFAQELVVHGRVVGVTDGDA